MKQSKWKSEYNEFLISHYENTSVKFCANYLNISEGLIKNNARKLNLQIRKTKKYIWSSSEDNFLIDNYPLYGMRYCIDHLHLSHQQIHNRCSKLKLSLSEEYKLGKRNAKININNFYNIQDPKIAYFLGFMWADGYISKSKNKIRIKLTCVEEDIDALSNVIDFVGDFNIHKIDRRNINPKLKIYTELSSGHIELHSYLYDNDFTIKSYISPIKILSCIPSYLYRYFILGWIDGDGCLYNHKEYGGSLSVASTYEYDWSILETLYEKLNITYTITRTTHKIGKSSKISIFNKKSLIAITNYLWPNGYEIGLYRKYLKAYDIISKYKPYIIVHTPFGSFRTIKEAGKALNISYNDIKNITKSNIIIDKNLYKRLQKSELFKDMKLLNRKTKELGFFLEIKKIDSSLIK